ncbi:MAG: hypothetical protein WCI51_03395 [Lentisphaerota bacterium]
MTEKQNKYSDPIEFMDDILKGLSPEIANSVVKSICLSFFDELEYIYSIKAIITEIPNRPLAEILKKLDAATQYEEEKLELNDPHIRYG